MLPTLSSGAAKLQDVWITVYVDDARIPWRGRRWSHLVADAPEELHRAAQVLGLKREWAQTKSRTLHYDVPDEVRERAIELEIAEPITWRELIRRRTDQKFV